MRIGFVAVLTLALAAAPAALAAICRCADEGSAEVGAATICCCEPTGGCACCAPEDEESTPQLEQSCACSTHVPQTSGPPAIQLPEPVAGTEVVLAEPRPLAGVCAPRVFVVRGDPHPAVLLPLLL